MDYLFSKFGINVAVESLMHLFADGVLSTVTLYLIQLIQFGTAFLETCFSACVRKGYSSKYFAGNLNR